MISTISLSIGKYFFKHFYDVWFGGHLRTNDAQIDLKTPILKQVISN